MLERCRRYQRHRRHPPPDPSASPLVGSFVPIVRSDLATDRPTLPVTAPLSTVRSSLCEGTTTVARDEMAAWACVTSGEFEQMVLPGGHFFLRGSEWARIGAIEETHRRLSGDAV